MRILLVVHGFPPEANGGTEVYVRELARALAQDGKDDVAVLTRHCDNNARDLSVRRWNDKNVDVFSVNNTFHSCDSYETSYTHPSIEGMAGDFLDEWRPDVVHIQHLTCLSTGIPRQAAERRIPVVMTLNDYWLICHRGQLVDVDGNHCRGPWEDGCGRCVAPGALAPPTAFRSVRTLQSFPIPGVSTAIGVAAKICETAIPADRTRAATVARLAHMKAAITDVSVLLAPSDTLAAEFAHFGLPAERCIRCDQGISTERFARIDRKPSPHLRVGFAGGLVPTKGADVLISAIERLPADRIRVDVLGNAAPYHGDRRFADAWRPRLGHPVIRRLGPVSHDRMPEVLADVDILVVPSTWIENAPFIIREAFAARVPVIASDRGGMAEMVRHGINGLLFPAGDAVALAAALQRFLDEPDLLPALRAGISPPISIEDDAAWLRTIYRRAGATSASAPVPAASKPLGRLTDVARVTAVVLNYQTPDDTYVAVRSLQSSFTRPSEILVIDNHSDDGSAATLERSLADVRVIESLENRGFAGGCNIGIRAALDNGAQFVLLVNSDAVLAPDAMELLLEAMASRPRLGIAAPILLSRQEPDHVASAGISFSRSTGRMRHRAAGRRVSAIGSDFLRAVDAVSGCVMLIRREVFAAIGLFDEAYFFSFEDIDFCLRARDAGFEIACVQDARAYHEGGRTIGGRSARRVYFGTRNQLRLAAKAGAGTPRPLRLALVAGFNAAYVLVSPDSPLVSGSAAFLRGVWHHAVGRYGAG